MIINKDDKDALDKYFKLIARYKLLSIDEELKTAKLSFEKHDLAARNKLINSNLKFVVKIAHKYAGYVNNKNIMFFDLIQAGNMGLIRAAEKFNPGVGVRFISYAVYWVTSKIRLFIADHSHMIKITTTTGSKALFFKRSAVSKYLESDSDDREKCKKEIMKQYNGFLYSDIDAFVERLFTTKDMISLDSLIPNSGESENFHDITTNRKNNDQNDQCIRLENKDFVKKLNLALLDSTKGLKSKQKEVISKRFFSSDRNGKQITLGQIGKENNLSRERIRQIESVAIKKMKESLIMNNKELIKLL